MPLRSPVSSSSSSSELLKRRRLAVRTGDGGFLVTVVSTSKDLGLYFGNAEPFVEVLGRRVDVRAGAGRADLGLTALPGDEDRGSGELVPLEIVDARRECFVMVLFSGDALLFSGDATLSSFSNLAVCFSAEERVGARRLDRLASLAAFFAALSLSEEDSLFMTSARALPTEASVSDCRIELRVVGLERMPELAAVATSADMMNAVDGELGNWRP